MSRPRSVVTAMLMGLLTSALAAAQALRVAEGVDLNRYAGKWYEIARLPNKSQIHCAGEVIAQYAVRADGRVDVINQCRTSTGRIDQARGIARKGKSGNSAALQVRFAPPILSFLPSVWDDYCILAVGPDYTWAVAGAPNRQLLWILSRAPSMSDASYAQAIEIVKGNGFDAARLVKTPQKN